MGEPPLTGPIEPRLGRWLLERLVVSAVRYGHPFAVALARTSSAEETAERLAAVLRGADVLVAWKPGELLMLLPDTAADGAARALARLRAAAPEAELSAVTWQGDVAEDLLDRLATGLGALRVP
jgi:hypothetical protein